MNKNRANTLTASKSEKKLKSLQGLHFLPLGGSGEIGMNTNLYFSQGQWIMVDNGVTFDNNPERVLMTDIRAFITSIEPKSLQGLVITHAHEDHVGAAAYLWPYLECPIYATPFTAYHVRYKLKDVGLSKVPVIEVPLNSSVKVGEFDVEFISLTHSIPESSALVLRTREGTVFHTGDWKIDPNPLIGKPIDEEKLQRIGDEGVLALVCDSTNVFEEGASGSEADVREALIKTVGECTDRRIVVSCFSSNLARVQTCYEAATQNDRQVCLLGRSLHRMVEAAKHCGYFPQDMAFVEPEDIAGIPPSKLMIITTGSQAEPHAGLTRMAQGSHRHVTLGENDTVIFSSRVIPSNQKAISNLKNALVRRNVHIIDGKDTLHVSGHPCRGELRKMYEWLRPQILLPVHGEDLHIQEHARFGKECGIQHTIRPHDGRLFHLSDEGARHVGEVATGQLALDGIRLVEADGEISTQRRQLLEGGFLCVAVTGSRDRGKIVSYKIFSRGVFEREEEKKQWESNIKQILTEAWNEGAHKGHARKNPAGSQIKIELPEISKKTPPSAPQSIGAYTKRVVHLLRARFYKDLKIRPFIDVYVSWA